MIGRLLCRVTSLTLLIICASSHASPGPLFTVIGFGGGGALDTNICLNGEAGLSCQQFHVTGGHTLTITPTIPNHYYPAIGVEILTPNVTVANCPNLVGNRCLFAASATQPATLSVASTQTLCSGNNATCRIFVTQTFVTGNISTGTLTNGPDTTAACPTGNPQARANCICNAEAQARYANNATYAAWLSAQNFNAQSIVTSSANHNTTYVTTSNATIFAAGQLGQCLSLTHSIGGTGIQPNPFTYTSCEGTAVDTGASPCTEWTSTTGSAARAGNITTTSSTNWTNFTSKNCDTRGPLYCFEIPAS